MTDTRALVLAALTDVAPDIDPATVDPAARLQEDLDLDSMDFLNLVTALSEQTGIDIPEADYDRLGSVDDCVAYLAQRSVAT
jgi:acyl carrier protein